MTFYDLSDILICFTEAIIAFLLFNLYMKKREKTHPLIYCIGVIALAFGIYASNKFFSVTYSNALCMIIIMVIISSVYKSDLITRILLSVTDIAISSICEIVILYLLAVVKNMSTEAICISRDMCVLGAVLSKFLNLGIIEYVYMSGKNKKMKIQKKYAFLFIFIFFVFLCITYLMFNPPQEKILVRVALLSSVGLMLCILGVLYLYENMSKQAEELRKKELTDFQIQSQSKYLKELIIAHQSARSIKHDLKNHMIILQSYLDKNDYTGCRNYAEKLSDGAGINYDFIDTGNPAIDTIISAKRSLAEKKNIDFYTKIHIPQNMSIDQTDCSVIFGNALDNAIEACDRLENQKYIKVFLSYHENSLICKIINSAIPENNRQLKTTKTDKENHGIGIMSIKNSINKYKNIYSFRQEENEFIFSFVLYNI